MDVASFESVRVQRNVEARIQVDANLPQGESCISLLESGYDPHEAPEIVAVCSRDGQLFSLNFTALLVLQQLDHSVSYPEVVERVASRFPAEERSAIEADIRKVLLDLQEHGLIDFDG